MEAEARGKIRRYESATTRSQLLREEERSLASRLAELDAEDALYSEETAFARETLLRRTRACKAELRSACASADSFRRESGRAKRRLESAHAEHVKAVRRLAEDVILAESVFPCPVCRAPVSTFVVPEAAVGCKGTCDNAQGEQAGQGFSILDASTAVAKDVDTIDSLGLELETLRYLEKLRKDITRIKAKRDAKERKLKDFSKQAKRQEAGGEDTGVHADEAAAKTAAKTAAKNGKGKRKHYGTKN